MQRREMLKLLPLSMIGMAAGVKAAVTPSAPLGLRYLERVRDLLEHIRSSQSDELLEASHIIARTRQNGGTCWFEWDMGHSTGYDIWPDRPGHSDILTFGMPESAGTGDLILTDCYTDRIPLLHDSGTFLISGPRPWGGDCIGSELLKPEMQRMKLKTPRRPLDRNIRHILRRNHEPAGRNRTHRAGIGRGGHDDILDDGRRCGASACGRGENV